MNAGNTGDIMGTGNTGIIFQKEEHGLRVSESTLRVSPDMKTRHYHETWKNRRNTGDSCSSIPGRILTESFVHPSGSAITISVCNITGSSVSGEKPGRNSCPHTGG